MAFAVGLSSGDAAAAVIEGVVLSSRGPTAGAEVLAYGRYRDIVEGQPVKVSTAGERPGFYRLELPPGRYFLVARGGEDGFCFHGSNPVEVGGDRLWLPFLLVSGRPPVRTAAPATALRGTVSYKGEPVEGAQVELYATADEQFKAVGLRSRTTSADGSFAFPVAAGSYVVIARKRSATSGSMKLRKGDLFCHAVGNPLKIDSGEEAVISVPCYPRDDIESFLGEGIAVKRNNMGRRHQD
ncbi:MAG TPA: carboxypeptidase-like regulatory domain-containing protein [Geobacteraceae bacterium]